MRWDSVFGRVEHAAGKKNSAHAEDQRSSAQRHDQLTLAAQLSQDSRLSGVINAALVQVAKALVRDQGAGAKTSRRL